MFSPRRSPGPLPLEAAWRVAFQFRGLFFQRLQSARFLHIHAAILTPPPVVGLPTDVSSSANFIGRQSSGLRFSQDANDLFGPVSRFFMMISSVFQGNHLISNGPVCGDSTSKTSSHAERGRVACLWHRGEGSASPLLENLGVPGCAGLT